MPGPPEWPSTALPAAPTPVPGLLQRPPPAHAEFCGQREGPAQPARQTVITPCSTSFRGGEWLLTLSSMGHACLKAKGRDSQQVNYKTAQLMCKEAAAKLQGRARSRPGLTSWTGACCSSGRQEGATSAMTAKPPLAPTSLPCAPTRAAVRRSTAHGKLAEVVLPPAYTQQSEPTPDSNRWQRHSPPGQTALASLHFTS